MADVVQILDELIRRLTLMRTTYTTINGKHQKSNTDQLMLTSIDKWTRGSGGMFGHLAEFEKFHKHYVLKNRPIGSAKNTGDVVIGAQGSPYAKTIQSKAITSDAPNSVETHIQKAVEQIAGLYHENPRQGDHLVVSIAIFNDVNPWPYTNHELGGGRPQLHAFQQRIISAVQGAVQKVILSGASNATNSLKNNLQRGAYESQSAPGPKSPALYQQQNVSFNFYDPVKDSMVTRFRPQHMITPTFYTKIAWTFGYDVIDAMAARRVKTIVVRYNPQGNSFQVARIEYF